MIRKVNSTSPANKPAGPTNPRVSGVSRPVLWASLLLLILGLGFVLTLLIASENWYLLGAAIFVVPAIILFLRYPFAAILVWLLILPYFAGTPTAAERNIFWILHRAMIPAALVLALLAGRLRARKRTPFRIGAPEWAMLAFLGLALVSILLWSEAPTAAFIHLYDAAIVPFCAYWLVRLSLPETKNITPLLVVAFVTLIAQCTIGILSWLAPQLLPDQWLLYYSERTAGSLRNPDVYTSTLLFCGLLLYHFAMNCASKWIRALLVSAFGLAIFCVLLSFSRASWLGCLAVLAGLLLVYPKATFRIIVILVLLVSLLGFSVLTDALDWAGERLFGQGAEGTAEARVVIGSAMLQMIEVRPYVGWGYGRSGFYSQRFVTSVGRLRAAGRENIPSHNSYLTLAADLGIPALLVYLFPVGWWLVLSLKVRRRLPALGFWSWRLLAVLWLLMLHMFVVNNFIDVVRTDEFGTTIWWLTLGLIAVVVQPLVDPVDKENRVRAPRVL